ncbi:MAG: BrnT family toxin [Saccharospirillum sp.]
MQFEWDKAKNLANIRKHGIDFSDVPDIFNHPMLTMEDSRDGYSEERWIAIGWIQTRLALWSIASDKAR